MIYLETVKRFCKEYWLIENYDQAMADETQTWHCHHRHEIDWVLPKEELIAIGRYYNVHHSELIFLTPIEHRRLHMEYKDCTFKGKHHTEEWKQKRSTAMKGENNPNYGKEGPMKGKHHTEESKAKMSNAMKGKRTGEDHPMYGVHRFGEKAPNYKYNITEEELYDLYIVQGLSLKQIAKIYGCHQGTIFNKLKKYNIFKHGK